MLDQVFELFMSLNATDEQLDFPFIYCSAKLGYAKTELEHVSGTMEPLFDAIVKHIPPPRAKAGEGFQVLVANLDYSDYLGRIAFGKIYEGKVKVGDAAICRHGDGRTAKGKITDALSFRGHEADRNPGSARRRHRRHHRLRGRVHRRNDLRQRSPPRPALHSD